jgi:hypothetical protein
VGPVGISVNVGRELGASDGALETVGAGDSVGACEGTGEGAGDSVGAGDPVGAVLGENDADGNRLCRSRLLLLRFEHSPRGIPIRQTANTVVVVNLMFVSICMRYQGTPCRARNDE